MYYNMTYISSYSQNLKVKDVQQDTIEDAYINCNYSNNVTPDIRTISSTMQKFDILTETVSLNMSLTASSDVNIQIDGVYEINITVNSEPDGTNRQYFIRLCKNGAPTIHFVRIDRSRDSSNESSLSLIDNMVNGDTLYVCLDTGGSDPHDIAFSYVNIALKRLRSNTA